MAKEKKVYTNSSNGQPLITTISTGCKTPVLTIKFSSLVNPYYYPNSPTIKRFSVTCLADPTVHKEFLKGIQTIEKNEGVESIIKNEVVKENDSHSNTGKVLIKFQGKEIIPVYVYNEKGEPEPIELEDELAAGEKVVIVYDILRYTKKNSIKTEHGISFKPSCIYYYPEEK